MKGRKRRGCRLADVARWETRARARERARERETDAPLSSNRSNMADGIALLFPSHLLALIDTDGFNYGLAAFACREKLKAIVKGKRCQDGFTSIAYSRPKFAFLLN
jgi:hypothetical protein